MNDPPDDSGNAIARADIVNMLAPALGEAKAAEVVRQASIDLQISNGELTERQGLAVLDKIAYTPGLIGISARFVKSRLILKWGGGH